MRYEVENTEVLREASMRPGDEAKNSHEYEKAEAMKTLAGADGFVLIGVHKKEGGMETLSHVSVGTDEIEAVVTAFARAVTVASEMRPPE